MAQKNDDVLQRLDFLKTGRELLLLEFLSPPPDILKYVYLFEADGSVQDILLECLKCSWISKWVDAAAECENVSEHMVSEIIANFTGFQATTSLGTFNNFFSNQKDGLEMILKASTKSSSRIDAVRAALYKHRAVLNRRLKTIGESCGNR